MSGHDPIGPEEMLAALGRLAELASADSIELQLRVVGGAVMMLEFKSRTVGTNDLDVLSASPSNNLQKYCSVIADERGWTQRWLNDSAAKFEREAKVPDNEDHEIFRRPGLTLTRPSLIRMLAWKLDRFVGVDREDALVLLRRILAKTPYDLESLWLQLEGHLPLGDNKEAYYNLQDLWEDLDSHHA